MEVTKTSSADDIVNNLVNVCNDFKKKYSISKIGVGTPGLISNGEVSATNLPFKGFKLAKVLEDRLRTLLKKTPKAHLQKYPK